MENANWKIESLGNRLGEYPVFYHLAFLFSDDGAPHEKLLYFISTIIGAACVNLLFKTKVANQCQPS